MCVVQLIDCMVVLYCIGHVVFNHVVFIQLRFKEVKIPPLVKMYFTFPKLRILEFYVYTVNVCIKFYSKFEIFISVQ